MSTHSHASQARRCVRPNLSRRLVTLFPLGARMDIPHIRRVPVSSRWARVKRNETEPPTVCSNAQLQATFVAAVITTVHGTHCSTAGTPPCLGLGLVGQSMGAPVAALAASLLLADANPSRRAAGDAVRLLVSFAGPLGGPPLDVFPGMRALYERWEAPYAILAISHGDLDVQVRPWRAATAGAGRGGGKGRSADLRLTSGAWASVPHDAVWSNQALRRVSHALRCAAAVISASTGECLAVLPG